MWQCSKPAKIKLKDYTEHGVSETHAECLKQSLHLIVTRTTPGFYSKTV